MGILRNREPRSGRPRLLQVSNKKKKKTKKRQVTLLPAPEGGPRGRGAPYEKNWKGESQIWPHVLGALKGFGGHHRRLGVDRGNWRGKTFDTAQPRGSAGRGSQVKQET